ncbi:hypothetical protein KUCAC02_021450 [Chaenocephalus aceratus]|uniref:Uncharacterized protein n=1 Tax=Chaenocephalus aceratus TaxID=36190 RepID=A0ACB9XG64_CHAAC|nr:hypothetical protein KUCAC02_021450 [Chaenocephalus aceratus]
MARNPKSQRRRKKRWVVEGELPLGVEEMFESGDPVLDLATVNSSACRHESLNCCIWRSCMFVGNSLRTLPDSISQLKGLRVLALDFNKMEDVPPAVCELTKLTRLYLGSNRLMCLPPELKNLRSLRCLWVEKQLLPHISPGALRPPQPQVPSDWEQPYEDAAI